MSLPCFLQGVSQHVLSSFLSPAMLQHRERGSCLAGLCSLSLCCWAQPKRGVTERVATAGKGPDTAFNSNLSHSWRCRFHLLQGWMLC